MQVQQRGVPADNGMSYGIPNFANTVLRIDRASDIILTTGNAGSGTWKW